MCMNGSTNAMILAACSQLLSVLEFLWVNSFGTALANNLWQEHKKIGAHLAVFHAVSTLHSKSQNNIHLQEQIFTFFKENYLFLLVYNIKAYSSYF